MAQEAVPVPPVIHAAQTPAVPSARSWSRGRRAYQCKIGRINSAVCLLILFIQDAPALINEDSNSNSATKAMEWGDYYMNEDDYAMQVGMGAGYRVGRFFCFFFLLFLRT